MTTSPNDYVVTDQVFAWNKYVKLFSGCRQVSALVSVAS